MPKNPHSERSKRLRAALAEARKKAGLTQADVAKRLSRPQSFVAKYENGERRLDVLEFLDVTAAIGCDAARIIKQL
jgi:transcriptional regulator with XRE-family HTH domain